MEGVQPCRRRGGVRGDQVLVEHVLCDVHHVAAMPPIQQPIQPEALVGDVARKPHRKLGLVVAHLGESALAVAPVDLRRGGSLLDEPRAVRESEVVRRRECRNQERIQLHQTDVLCKRDARHPAHVLGTQRKARHGDVDAAISDLGAATSIVDALRESCALCQGLLQDQVGVVLLIDRRRESEPGIEEPGVDPGFDFAIALRVESRVGDDVARGLNGDGVLPSVAQAAQRRELLAIERLVSGLTVRGAELQLFEGPEHRPAVRGRSLRIVEQLADVDVVRALLRQHATRDEQALAEQQQLFLREHRQRASPLPIREHAPRGAPIHVLLSREEILRHVVGSAQVVIPAAHPSGRRRRERLRLRRVAVGQRPGDRGLRLDAAQIGRQPGQTGLLPVERGRRVDVYLLLEGVDAPVDGRPQLVRVTAQERVGRVHGADEAEHVLGRLELSHRLEQVGPAAEGERIEGIHAVLVRAHVEEARGLADYEVGRDVDVVIVADAALRERVDQVRVDLHLELRSHQLRQVEADPLLVVAGAGHDPVVVLVQR